MATGEGGEGGRREVAASFSSANLAKKQLSLAPPPSPPPLPSPLLPPTTRQQAAPGGRKGNDMLARPRKKVLECHSALLRVRYYVRGSFSVRPLLPPSSIDCCVRKNGLECGMRHPEWQDGSELVVCRREGGRCEGGFAEITRASEPLSRHGIVSGFRIVSPLCLTQRDLGDGERRRQAEREGETERPTTVPLRAAWID